MVRSLTLAPTEVVRFVLARLDDEEALIRRNARSLRGQDDPQTGSFSFSDLLAHERTIRDSA